MPILCPYAQGSDLVARFDARIVSDFSQDAGVRPTDPTTEPNVLTALLDGASMIDAAAQVGERYTPAELTALTGTDQALLFRLNCDLAFIFLMQRRGVTGSSKYGDLYKVVYERSFDILQKLRDGAMIFGVSADVGAGLPSINFPSIQARNTINLLRDQARRLFPTRPRQFPSSS